MERYNPVRTNPHLSPFVRNQSGFSLIETSIAFGLMMLLSLAFTNMLSQSRKATQELEEKLAIMDFQRDLTTATLGRNLCQSTFTNNAATFTIPVASFPPTAALAMNGLHLDAAGTVSFATVNSKLFPNSNIVVENISLSNFTGTGPTYSADLTIATRNTNIKRRPIISRVTIDTTTDGTNVVMTGCKVIAGTGGGGSGDPGAINSEEICNGLGGFWTDPGGGRPAFCSFDSEGMDWF